jgi:hypothetical protein
MLIDKRSPLRVSVSIALALSFGHTAVADNGITTSLSGYGTVGGTFTSDNNFQYIHDGTEFSGAGHQIDMGLDSRIGVQAVFDFGSGFSVTAQELAKQRGFEAFSLGTEWLYVQYAPNSDLKLRLGRVALATFLYSDSRNVGYTMSWFNAPNEIYAAEPYQNIDGAQVVWHHNIGPIGIGLEGAYGNANIPTLNQGVIYNVKAKSGTNVAATLEYGDFLFRVAQTNLNFPTVIPLSPTYTLTTSINDKFVSTGLQYDNGTAIVLSEYAKRSEPPVPVLGVLSGATQWYVAGGWRFGKLTPLVSYAAFKPIKSVSLPAGSYSTPSLSLRYDVVANVALKAQVSRAQAGNNEYWAARSPTSDQRINVFSLGADFVF